MSPNCTNQTPPSDIPTLTQHPLQYAIYRSGNYATQPFSFSRTLWVRLKMITFAFMKITETKYRPPPDIKVVKPLFSSTEASNPFCQLEFEIVRKNAEVTPAISLC